MNKTLEISPSIRSHFVELFFSGLFLLFLIFTAGIFPEKGLFLVDLKELNVGSGVLIFEKNIYVLIVFAVIFFTLLSQLYGIIKTRMFVINLDKNNIEFRHGIFFKSVESIDMNIITDYVKKRGPIDQLLGLANVTVHSIEQRTPEITFHGIDVEDAKQMLLLLEEYTSGSQLEYLVNRGANGKVSTGVLHR